MNTPTAEQKRALILIVSAITDTIKEAGELGAPAGVMFAALSAQGCTLNQFKSIMDALVRLGRVRKDGDCYVMDVPPVERAMRGERQVQA